MIDLSNPSSWRHPTAALGMLGIVRLRSRAKPGGHRTCFLAGLWAEAADRATGELADTYTLIITDANAIMRVHDRMPVILAMDAARLWIEPGPLPAELLVPYQAEEMTAWRVADDAKNSRIEPHPGMAEPVLAAHKPTDGSSQIANLPQGARAQRRAP